AVPADRLALDEVRDHAERSVGEQTLERRPPRLGAPDDPLEGVEVDHHREERFDIRRRALDDLTGEHLASGTGDAARRYTGIGDTLPRLCRRGWRGDNRHF